MESLQGLVTSWLLFKVVDGNEVIVVPKSIENQIIKEAHILPAGNYKFLTATFLDSAYGKKNRSNHQQLREMYSVEKKGWKERMLALHWQDEPLHSLHVDYFGWYKQYRFIFAFTKFVIPNLKHWKPTRSWRSYTNGQLPLATKFGS